MPNAMFFTLGPTVPSIVTLWFCPECGHWAGSSYLKPPESNPDWRPRCKMKPPVKCSRPLMEPLSYVYTDPAGIQAQVDALASKQSGENE